MLLRYCYATTGGVWCYKSLSLVVVYHGGVSVLGPGLGTWSMTDVAGWSRCVGLGGGCSGVLDPMRGRGPPWHDGVTCLVGAWCWWCCMAPSMFVECLYLMVALQGMCQHHVWCCVSHHMVGVLSCHHFALSHVALWLPVHIWKTVACAADVGCRGSFFAI